VNLNTKRYGMGLWLLVAGAGCGSGGGTANAPKTEEEKSAAAMKTSMKADLEDLHAAAMALQAAAPSGHAWAGEDAAAIGQMKAAWIQARTAYEHVEGATAPIFPDIDIAIDERYDGFLAEIGPAGDANLFDDQGVTGMHAIERILYSDTIPANVTAFEASLPGYQAARYPQTAAEADAFKTSLCAKLVDDTKMLLDLWTSAGRLDVQGAFQGLIGLMNEQQEKVNNAASGEEESRYAQRTMADLRANLDGTTAIYGLFRDWLQSQPAASGSSSGSDVDTAIMNGFASLDGTYGGVAGDAIPTPPATWRAEEPSAADLATPFGMLYQSIHQAVDPQKAGSIVDNMNKGAMLLGIPGFDG
jgi:iron uptake system component EfeO